MHAAGIRGGGANQGKFGRVSGRPFSLWRWLTEWSKWALGVTATEWTKCPLGKRGHRAVKMTTRSGRDQSDILSLWLDQDLKMRSWFSGAYDMQRSTPQNEALKRGSLFKIKSSQWGLDTYQRQGSNPQNEVLIFSGSRFPRIKASKWGLEKRLMPSLWGHEIRSFFFRNDIYIRKNKLVLCFFDVPWGEVRDRSQAQKIYQKKGKNKWTIIKILPS